jgi:hypothetical protein
MTDQPSKQKEKNDKQQNQLKLLREIQKEKHFKTITLNKFYAKYKEKICLNPTDRAAFRIQYFAKKYFYRPLINLSNKEQSLIPNKYLLRLKFTKANKEKPVQIQNQTNANISDIDKIYNAELEQAIQQSLQFDNDFAKTNKLIANDDSNNIEDFYVGVDLREYSKTPYNPFSIFYPNDYYLTFQQVEYVRRLWNRINPDTENGKRFEQELKYGRALCAIALYL